MKKIVVAALLALCAFLPARALAADGGVCPRAEPGSEVQRPPDLYSENKILNVNFGYYTAMDHDHRTLFCFVTDGGLESPTLHVNPGDKINITLTNMVPPVSGGASEVMSGAEGCGDATMTPTSINMHFHGTNTSPKCHSDETIRTLINSGSTFTYTLRIPEDEPPGLYWYHPHVHGTSSMMLQGGATGAIEVEGIQNVQPAVAGLPERYLVLRDEQLGTQQSTDNDPDNPMPNWDVSVNYVPVYFPRYIPSVIKMQKGGLEFWRVVNAGANTILNLEVTYDGVKQPLQVVALDGVPTGSKDGHRQGTIVTEDNLLLPPSSRAEFILRAPQSSRTVALFETRSIRGGPASDSNPARPLARIDVADGPAALPRMAASTVRPRHLRFDDLANAKVTASRELYFSEKNPPGHPPELENTVFFITVKGQDEVVFDPDNPPAITTTQGSVEEWTIKNRTAEVHEFHMHQIHFLVEEVNGVKIPKPQQQLYDVFQIPFWRGQGHFPSIKVKMDFRGPDTGDFVYHCHILDHEDMGMMAIIRVLPRG